MEALTKESERWALDRFLALLGEPAPATIESSEEPDFVLTFGFRRVGVEMTALYWNPASDGRPRQEQESLRRRVVKLAERLYADRCVPALHVSVRFNDQFALDKASVMPLATRVADWAAAHVPQTGASFAEDPLNRAYFPRGLRALRVDRQEWMRRSRFSVSDAAWVPELAVSEVRRALERKKSRYGAYLNKCSEVWLVINVDAGQLSTTFEIGDAIAETTYESPFDRVFLLQHMTPHLSELKRMHDFRQDT